MHVSYVAPTHPLAHEPRREWDAALSIYRRELCSYCTRPGYVYAPEEETGRYYCRVCIKKNKFAVKNG